MQTPNLRMVLAASILIGLLAPAVSRGQQGAPPDFPIDAQMRTEVIEAALTKLNENYVFPDEAKKMEDVVRGRLAKGEYDQITSAKQLCDTLMEHFREVSKDRHLGVMYSKNEIPRPMPPDELSAEDREQRRKEAREQQRKGGALSNYGFEKCERLPGNIGYLDFRTFADPELAGETAAAAMGFLANTDALLIDMRQNRGGIPDMVAVMCSWFFDQPVHLNDIYNRLDDETKQLWSLSYMPGKRYVGKDVYILTSRRTFSGAEGFTYNMQNLKRATVVGETTGGGAHPTRNVFINGHFLIRVPFARATSPITKSNWEGTGVTPDVACPADQALKVAHLAALQKKLDRAAEPEQVAALKRFIETTEKELAELKKQ
jgi:retinol-binding protein 3